MLALLDAFGGSLTPVEFQKLLFLYCQEVDDTPPYEFVPYRYGAFSFTSYADRRKLIAHGLLEDTAGWQLTANGRRVARRERDLFTDSFASRHRLRGEALVADTYRRYPYYAIRSELALNLLCEDEAARRRVEAARPETRAGTLVTIGYQGRTLDGYLNALIQAGATLLCDVRRNAISRKYGFSKRTLASSCIGVGIQYEHLPDLGILSTQRRGLNLQADYDALFARYRTRWLPRQGTALDRIQDWLRSECVTLTCFERDPHQCHRHCISTALEPLMRKRRTTTHL